MTPSEKQESEARWAQMLERLRARHKTLHPIDTTVTIWEEGDELGEAGGDVDARSILLWNYGTIRISGALLRDLTTCEPYTMNGLTLYNNGRIQYARIDFDIKA